MGFFYAPKYLYIMKKFIISESEKNRIRGMYGLIVEQNTNLPSLPYPVTGSWKAPDCDALHAFQSRQEDDGVDEKGKAKKKSVVFGDMSAKVCEALAIFWNKIPVKVTNVKVTVNGMNVSYEVTIDKSQDNIGMNGFTSKGAGCGRSLSTPEETKEHMKNRATTETGKSPSEIKTNIQALPNVGKLNYFEEVGSFYDPAIPDGNKIYQVFYQYQTQNPPQVKSQETIKKEQNVNTQQPVVITNQKPNQQQPVVITNQKPNVNNNPQTKSTNVKTSAEENKEITDYLDYYLKSKSCDNIANDMEEMQKTPAYTELSEDEKEKYNKAIMGLKNPGLAIMSKEVPCDGNIFSKNEVKCQCVKDYMRGEFTKQLSGENRQKVIVQICGFIKKFPPQKPLTVCSPKVNTVTPTNTGNNTNTGTNTNTTINTGNNTNTGTNTNTTINTGTSTKKNEPIVINTNTGTNTKKNEPIVINTNTNTTTPTTTAGNSSDYKLDTPGKIQHFQTWMDNNHGKWAYSKKYNKNYSVDGKPNKGYGNMGPNTRKAWNNSEYKTAYLKQNGL